MTIRSTSPDARQENSSYHSPYLAEYYDIYIRDRNDVPIYSRVLSELASRDEPVTVLDIGTGTGRIIHALAAQCPSTNVRFLGLDNVAAMLDRAPDDLESLSLWKDTKAQPLVDLAIFAFGSVTYMHEPDQDERFFEQIAKILRPNTGRAYISVLKVLSDGGEAMAQSAQPLASAVCPSKSFPDIIYRETWPSHNLVGNVWHTTRRIVVSQVMADGQEKVSSGLFSHLNIRKARIWTAADVRMTAAKTGLRLLDIIEDTDESPDEKIFVLGVDV
ncbi:hypothetical protein BO71DRAFT_426607 [Aspergillus ellipticus CBS 707.79]|uniref:Methyltransferase domain-containing protein n=1 Tax=Aspergillus ellipticus CBS 707.79 TaxID=1448320 RepID=A0A319DKH1_9EURO|nr:hypothetical protein BO71DRAFT_426607 [Aspergillus ellipticus CBS 707.79]